MLGAKDLEKTYDLHLQLILQHMSFNWKVISTSVLMHLMFDSTSPSLRCCENLFISSLRHFVRTVKRRVCCLWVLLFLLSQSPSKALIPLVGNMEMEPDIENMTMSKYLEYEAAKERRLWDDVLSRRSSTNYYEAGVDSFHRNKSKTFSYLYSHNLTPPHPCFLPVQPYPKNYSVSTNESNDVDIENITMAEYNLYIAKQGLGMNPLRAENMKRIGYDIVQDSIWEHDDDSKEDQEEDGDDGDTFDMWDITVEALERIRKFFNVPDEIDEIVQPVIPEPIHTTPPNDDYVASVTKSILDELLEEFGDEILNVAMIDEEADFNPIKDLEELEILLAMRPQSNFTEIQVDMDIISPGRMLNKLQESIPNRSSRMLYRMLKLHEMVDVAR
ncbi:hypothetical protein Tco_1216336 [Tanacetum coccineum]